MHGAVAQPGERLLCKEEVRGSSPLSSILLQKETPKLPISVDWYGSFGIVNQLLVRLLSDITKLGISNSPNLISRY